MMCDAFRRIRFAAVESYQYVGLGSVYFSDFALFHRALGIQKMVSIEKQLTHEQRFRDNLPYANVELLMGPTSTELPKVKLEDMRSIVWLDYDDPLSRGMLDDLRHVLLRVCSGTAIVVTVQAHPPSKPEGDSRSTVQIVSQQIGSDVVDPGLADEDFYGWGTAAIYRKALVDHIAAVLASRNATRPYGQQFLFEQVLNFNYRDGAPMLTVGGVIFDRGQKMLFDQCGFDELTFSRRGTEAFLIDIPLLTLRELRRLESQLPLPAGVNLELGSMPPLHADKFVQLYRYFPNFSNVDL